MEIVIFTILADEKSKVITEGESWITYWARHTPGCTHRHTILDNGLHKFEILKHNGEQVRNEDAKTIAG